MITASLDTLRMDNQFRQDVEQELRNLRAAGLTDREIGLWLAGARWSVRVCRMFSLPEMALAGPQLTQDESEGRGVGYTPTPHDPGCSCYDCLAAQEQDIPGLSGI